MAAELHPSVGTAKLCYRLPGHFGIREFRELRFGNKAPYVGKHAARMIDASWIKSHRSELTQATSGYELTSLVSRCAHRI